MGGRHIHTLQIFVYSEADRQMEMHMSHVSLFLICFAPQVDPPSTSGCVVRGSAVNSKTVSNAFA